MMVFESNTNDMQAKAAVLEQWSQAKRYKNSFPKYAVNWQKVFANPKATPMRGMHPDNPSVRIKAKEKK
jgi:hypothetical protein